MTVTPQQATDAANDAFGRHPGLRALHAKGTLLKGTFTASPAGARLTRAGHMQGEPIPATIRVSNGGGNPDVPDYAPDLRGLAVKLYLPGGERTDIVAQTAPRFSMHTPDAFVELLRAQKQEPAMAWKFPLFLARHPEALSGLPANLKALRPVASYATCVYYAIHAFRWLDADGGSRYVRYTLAPEAGDQRLGPRAAKALGRDYLQEEIRRRVADGPVRFALELQIAGSEDNVDDPASVWPKHRERVNAGTLEITALETERETGGDVLVFDPTRVVDGIELSNDPVLRFRHDAYSESVARRMSS
ncbi:MAG TPA: catalase family peroxidase [Solirubrobacteraceae bacterium]|nr:catalase family peroxidase [Solirubrobacteraceae bacterium]